MCKGYDEIADQLIDFVESYGVRYSNFNYDVVKPPIIDREIMRLELNVGFDLHYDITNEYILNDYKKPNYKLTKLFKNFIRKKKIEKFVDK